MSGGGGGGPTQSTTVTSNIPEYARPYVENMLEAGQRQLFETAPGADGATEITGFKPYSPYSTDPTAYFAGPSSLQQSSYNAAGQLQTPGQYQTGTQLATAAGVGGLGTQGQSQGLMGSALGYGQAGAGYGQAGQMYGAQGAQQAQRAAQQAQRAAGMYGAQGSMYGAQAANLAPAAQAYGQGAANIGMQGLGYGAQGAGYGQQSANMAGMGFGAGQQYASQVTNPNAFQAYMSPYQQAVTDVAKDSAVREAQMAETAGKLASARSGTYGGARQALMSAEREKNLLSNLSNIQAQGSQSAYDKAMQAQQFGANLGLQGLQAGYQGLSQGMQGAQTGLSGLGTAMQGQQAGLAGLQQAGSLYGQGMQGAGVGLSGVGQQLAGGQLGLQGTAQGIQGAQAGMQGAGVGLSGIQAATGAGQYGLQGLGQATQAASTLGQLGTSQQAADVQNINLQNQLGQQQQQYQQNIINQAIQDYATAQQYPYMQLSTMSNLLRGLPMQGMSTQQYQAQPSTTQQLLGLAGTGASLYGAMKREGGTIKEYAAGGSVGLGYADRGVVDSTRDRLEEMFGQDAEETSKYVAKSTSPMVKKLARELGIAAAPTGKLGRNMAGGGIIAFNGEEGSQVQDMTDEEREDYIKNNAYLQRAKGLKEFFAPLGKAENYDPVRSSYNLVNQAIMQPWNRFISEKPEDQATRFRKASARKEQAANPTQEVPAVKTATQRKEDNDRADALASVGQSTKVDYKKAEEILRAAKGSQGGDKGGDKGLAGNENAGTSDGRGASGIAAFLAEQDRLKAERGITSGMGEEARNLMDYIKEGKERRMSEAGQDRYLRMAEAFAKFGSTAGPMLGVAAESLGGYAKTEGAARKELRAAELADKKIAADIEKGQRLEARGDFDAAQKAFDSAENRKKDYDIARMQANKPGEFDRMYAIYAQNETDAGRKPTFEGFKKAYSSTDETGRLNAIYKADTVLANNTVYMGLANSKKPEDKQRAAQMRKDLIDEYMGAMGTTQTAGAGGGNKLRFDKDGKQV